MFSAIAIKLLIKYKVCVFSKIHPIDTFDECNKSFNHEASDK